MPAFRQREHGRWTSVRDVCARHAASAGVAFASIAPGSGRGDQGGSASDRDVTRATPRETGAAPPATRDLAAERAARAAAVERAMRAERPRPMPPALDVPRGCAPRLAPTPSPRRSPADDDGALDDADACSRDGDGGDDDDVSRGGAPCEHLCAWDADGDDGDDGLDDVFDGLTRRRLPSDPSRPADGAGRAETVEAAEASHDLLLACARAARDEAPRDEEAQ